MGNMVETDEKSAAERAISMLLATPGGLTNVARATLPKIVEAGRVEIGAANLTERVNALRLAGRLALSEARVELDKMNAQDQFGEEARAVGQIGQGSTERVVRSTPTAGPEAESLAVPDYDSLSASQVLPRLAALSAEELEAVRAYEDEHRGRRTVLARIAQLQASN